MFQSKIKVGILTISDSCYKNEKEDKSGACLFYLFTKAGFDVHNRFCVSDDYDAIKNILISWTDDKSLDVIVTTGGTGFSFRDVTPEATKSVIEKSADGLSFALLSESLKHTKMAMLCRLVCGIRKSTLIINFPGSLKACQECFQVIESVLKHAIDQLRGNLADVQIEHSKLEESTQSDGLALTDEDFNLAKDLGFQFHSSPYPLIEINTALSIIIDHVEPLSRTESFSINDTKALIGRRISSNIESSISLPPFSSSIKDGYAVISSDGSGDRKVVPFSITAGIDTNDIKIEKGWCVRINTGAPIPEGADAVIQVEDTEVIERYQDGKERCIRISTTPFSGQDIRPVGSDIKEGETIIRKATKLGPIELGLIASIGLSQVNVRAKPRVALLSTGNELCEPGVNLSFGKIWDSNRIMLLSLLRCHDIEVVDLGIVEDTYSSVVRKIKHGLECADVLITTGGVSMGERDILKCVLQKKFGVDILFGRVNIKPGKPTTFGICLFEGKKKYIFALPGNPVSAYVTCQLFALPTLDILSGRRILESPVNLFELHPSINVRLALTNKIFLDERPEFVRAIIKFDDDDIPKAILIKGSQASSRLMSMKDANALVMLPSKSQILENFIEGNQFIAKAILMRH